MVRENLATDSKNALMAITYGNGADYQDRFDGPPNSYTYYTPGPSVTAPYWVKLTRTTSGGTSTLNGYVSAGAPTAPPAASPEPRAPPRPAVPAPSRCPPTCSPRAAG